MIANLQQQSEELKQLYVEARRVDELEALYEAGQTLNQTLDLQETLTATLAITRSLIGAPVGHVYLYTLEHDRIASVITLGQELDLSDTDRRYAADIASKLLQEYRDNPSQGQQAVVTTTPAVSVLSDSDSSNKVQSWVTVPLMRVGNLPVGVLELGSDQPDAFSADDVRLVQVIAAQATTAIENSRLYEEVKSTAIQNANLVQQLSTAYEDLANQQTEILRSHKTLQALFDGITESLYIVDQELRIVAINQAEANRLGLTPDSLMGCICDARLWNEATSTLTKIIRDTFATGNEGNWESQVDVAHRGPFTDRDVRTYPIFLTPTSGQNVSASPGEGAQKANSLPGIYPNVGADLASAHVGDREGSPLHSVLLGSEKAEKGSVSQVIILAQDVSEKRRLQASLFRSANLAAVGRLASSITHQINNPLTVIIANSQLMELEADPDSPDYPLIQDIIESGTQIRQIVQNLSDFSSQDSYDWFETDIEETVESALALVAHPLRKSNIQVIQEFENLPSIIASARHLKLLWMNLLLNARDAIVEKRQEGVIKILGSHTAPDQVQIQIIDNGTGILPEYYQYLFQPFFTTKAPGQGLGLGLYTCRTITEFHQGQITIDDNPQGSGARVTVTLPLQNSTSVER
ncbi:MAG: ATP-binding protein [Anaerolineae bacterium]